MLKYTCADSSKTERHQMMETRMHQIRKGNVNFVSRITSRRVEVMPAQNGALYRAVFLCVLFYDIKRSKNIINKAHIRGINEMNTACAVVNDTVYIISCFFLYDFFFTALHRQPLRLNSRYRLLFSSAYDRQYPRRRRERFL